MMGAGRGRQDAGFSLIEVIIVVTLISFVYTVAMPEFNRRTEIEIVNKTNQLSSDIRNAYDLAVLTRKTLRMVFILATGEYWLEEADRTDVLLGNDKIGHDPSEDEEKDEAAAFETKFKDYVDLAGQMVMDQEKSKEIPPVSPVVSAKQALMKPKWTHVEGIEWNGRTLGPYLLIKDMQAEHHGQKQELSDLGEKGRAMIYFFPGGYVERAVLHLSYKKDEMVPDDTKQPFTVFTRAYEGTADVVSEYKDIDVKEDKDDEG